MIFQNSFDSIGIDLQNEIRGHEVQRRLLRRWMANCMTCT